jgi:xanthine dehydrogenase YagS FAD-binding subunit
VKTFDYARAQSPMDAINRFGPGTVYLGGGTNLVDLMRLGVTQPDQVVDVGRLPLNVIEPVRDRLRIGAAVRNSDLAADPVVRVRYPVLARAVLAGASGQIRNMATVGGNLLQRTRCAYFQDITRPCNKREPGTGCPAIDGDHTNLAILGASRSCVATHPSDMAVALAALDAEVHVIGPGGEQVIPMPGLHRLPGDTPELDTVLDPGMLIIGVELPAPPPGASVYRKVRERASFAFALVSIAAVLSVRRDGVIDDCRIALGGVAHAPWRCERAEQLLIGGPATGAAFLQAAEAELEQAEPLPRNAFKVPLARNLIVNTLEELAP